MDCKEMVPGPPRAMTERALATGATISGLHRAAWSVLRDRAEAAKPHAVGCQTGQGAPGARTQNVICS